MNDGFGSVVYNYNTLSRLTSEVRSFNGLSGPNGGAYTLSYGYNLVGELTSVTDPWNLQTTYTHDANGRVTSVGGAGFGYTNLAQNLAYRAFGAIKSMSYGNGTSLSTRFDNRLRLTEWNVPGVMGWDYYYNVFGENSQRVTYARSLNNTTLDRAYDYDHVGRLTESHTGTEAQSWAQPYTGWV
jgi:YD repeat-containing protein